MSKIYNRAWKANFTTEWHFFFLENNILETFNSPLKWKWSHLIVFRKGECYSKVYTGHLFMSPRFHIKIFSFNTTLNKAEQELKCCPGNGTAAAFDSVFQPRSLLMVSLAFLNNCCIVCNGFRPLNQILPAFLFNFTEGLWAKYLRK